MRIATTKVYQFKELTEEAQRQAIERLWDINIDHEWWDGDLEWFNADLFEPIGISVAQMYFDLDRGAYIAFDRVHVINARKLLKASGIDLRSKVARQALENGISITFETNTNLSAGKVTAEIDFEYDELDQVADAVYQVAQDCLKKLKEECEYYTSREAIVETIEANEYEFTEDGKLF